jgi:hypothetical protein
VSSPGGELRGEGWLVRPAERVSFASVVRGLAGSLVLEDVRRSARFEELLVEESNPVPVSFSLGEFAGQSEGVSPERVSPVPSGGFGGLQVQGPSVVEERVASARASRLGRLSPSLDDWVAAGSGRR